MVVLVPWTGDVLVVPALTLSSPPESSAPGPATGHADPGDAPDALALDRGVMLAWPRFRHA